MNKLIILGDIYMLFVYFCSLPVGNRAAQLAWKHGLVIVSK